MTETEIRGAGDNSRAMTFDETLDAFVTEIISELLSQFGSRAEAFQTFADTVPVLLDQDQAVAAVTTAKQATIFEADTEDAFRKATASIARALARIKEVRDQLQAASGAAKEKALASLTATMKKAEAVEIRNEYGNKAFWTTTKVLVVETPSDVPLGYLAPDMAAIKKAWKKAPVPGVKQTENHTVVVS